MVFFKLNSVKRGVTYIEVISFLFIMTIIFTVSLPSIMRFKEGNIDMVTNKVILEIKHAKSLAISKNTNIHVKFLDFNAKGYSLIETYEGYTKLDEYRLPKDYVVIINEKDLYYNSIVFKENGSLNHGATTISVLDMKNNKLSKVTLTIGYTRIMKVE